MNGGLLDAFLLKLQHDRFDFLFRQNEVTHHHRLARHLFEGHPGTQSKARSHGYAIFDDLHVLTGQRELIHTTGLHLSGSTQRYLHGLPGCGGILLCLSKRTTQ